MVFLTMQRAARHETHVRLRLPEQNDVHEVEVAYLVQNEAAVTSTYRFDSQAPARVNVDTSLAPGHYAVRILLTHASHIEEVMRAMDVPTQGAVTFDLTETH